MNIFDELSWRGLVHQVSDAEGLRKYLEAPGAAMRNPRRRRTPQPGDQPGQAGGRSERSRQHGLQGCFIDPPPEG